MCETGPQVLSPVRKPNQVDTVTWDVTRDFYTRWRASIVYSSSSTLFLLFVFCSQASVGTDSRSLVVIVWSGRNLPPLFGNCPRNEQSSQFSYQFALLFTNCLPSKDENSRERRANDATRRLPPFLRPCYSRRFWTLRLSDGRLGYDDENVQRGAEKKQWQKRESVKPFSNEKDLMSLNPCFLLASRRTHRVSEKKRIHTYSLCDVATTNPYCYTKYHVSIDIYT